MKRVQFANERIQRLKIQNGKLSMLKIDRKSDSCINEAAQKEFEIRLEARKQVHTGMPTEENEPAMLSAEVSISDLAQFKDRDARI